MGHHFVPRFYLSGFTRDEAIWAFDRVTNRAFPTQPKSVANETNMYPAEIEAHLADKVEEPAKPCIEKVRARQSLTAVECEILAKYIVNLWKRVPEGRERVSSRFPEVAAAVRRDAKAKLEASAAEDPTLSELAAARIKEVDEVIDRYEQAPPPHFWQNSLRVEPKPGLVDALLSMRWTFLFATQSQYITCDNPVFFFQDLGVGHSEGELSVPFASDVCLWASRLPGHSGQFQPAKPAVVKELNRRTASNTTRFAFAATNEPWILPLVRKDRHLLNRLL